MSGKKGSKGGPPLDNMHARALINQGYEHRTDIGSVLLEYKVGSQKATWQLVRQATRDVGSPALMWLRYFTISAGKLPRLVCMVKTDGSREGRDAFLRLVKYLNDHCSVLHIRTPR